MSQRFDCMIASALFLHLKLEYILVYFQYVASLCVWIECVHACTCVHVCVNFDDKIRMSIFSLMEKAIQTSRKKLLKLT